MIKLTDEEKASVDTSTDKLEEAIKLDSLEAIEVATKELNEVLTPLTQKLYPQAEDSQPDNQGDDSPSDENTVDAEYEEVQEEEKEEEKK